MTREEKLYRLCYVGENISTKLAGQFLDMFEEMQNILRDEQRAAVRTALLREICDRV
jgi:hypothetical protein